MAFCGVVGHPQRHEYTVIGQKVNMAARLMMAFPGSVVSDETTKTKSGLAPSQFVLQPPVCLKGIKNPENVYKFLTERYVSIKTSGRTCPCVGYLHVIPAVITLLTDTTVMCTITQMPMISLVNNNSAHNGYY